MNCDGIQQLLVKAIAKCRVMLALDGNHRLEGFQRLDRTLEADRTRVDAMFRRGLGHDRTDEVVGQDMCPYFLPNQFRCFAS